MEKDNTLHPSVVEFKAFVKEHPLVLEKVKRGEKSLQAFFEEWTILGAEHEQWSRFKEEEPDVVDEEEAKVEEETPKEEAGEERKQESLGQLFQLVKNINMNELQQHLAQFSSVIGNVQNLVQSFSKSGEGSTSQDVEHPFSFRRD